jgi:hypothetical protein
MTDGLTWHRIQFAFSVTFHYLFPQLTMGLSSLSDWWPILGPIGRSTHQVPPLPDPLLSCCG